MGEEPDLDGGVRRDEPLAVLGLEALVFPLVVDRKVGYTALLADIIA